jgi:hypothetical protein
VTIRTDQSVNNGHQPEPWYWAADSEHCPHGPEPEDDTTDAWAEWDDRHTWSPQDVQVCLDAPIGDCCPECSADRNDLVLWADCEQHANEPAPTAAGTPRPAHTQEQQ